MDRVGSGTSQDGTKALKPGKYLVVLTANDAAGNMSTPKTIKFTIAKH